MNLLITFFITLGIQGSTQAGWQDIRPMQSTCEDVTKIFGGNACNKKSVSYERPGELVTVVFSQHSCDTRWPYEEYSAAPGTVTDVIVIPRFPKQIRLSDLRLNKSQFQRRSAGDMIGAAEYVNNGLGIRITATTDDRIIALDYFPSSKYEYLRCFPEDSSRFAGIYGASSREIASYDPSSTDEVLLSLKKVAASLSTPAERNTPRTLVYVIAYAGRVSSLGAAKKSTEDAKSLLVTQYGIDQDRIVTIDGGFQEKPKVQIFLRHPGAAPPQIKPTIYPGDIRQTGH